MPVKKDFFLILRLRKQLSAVVYNIACSLGIHNLEIEIDLRFTEYTPYVVVIELNCLTDL